MAENFILVEAANAVLRSLFEEQVNAFGAQQRAIEALNSETREIINRTRDDVNESLMANK